MQKKNISFSQCTCRSRRCVVSELLGVNKVRKRVFANYSVATLLIWVSFSICCGSIQKARLHSLTVRGTRNEGHLLLPVQFHHNYGELKYVA
jgi:hypothetical protein